MSNPKRRPLSPSTPSKNKRLKTLHNQAQIEHFFTSPKSKTGAHEDNCFQQGSSSKNVSNQGDSARSKSSILPEVIDVDSIDLDDTTKLEHDSPPDAAMPSPEETHSANDSTNRRIIMRPRKDNTTTTPLTFSPLDIDPTLYQPDSQPSESVKAPYALLTHAFVTLSQTRSRISIINTLTNVLRTIILKHPTSLLPAIYLLSNSLAPAFVPTELGLGSSVISKALQQISGLSAAALRRLYNTTGDLGDVAFSAKSNLRTLIPHAPLSIPHVYESLLKISLCKGQGTAKEKQKIVEKLLLAASGEEVRYLTRTLSQNLRVGAVRTSILSALARAMVITPSPLRSESVSNDSQRSFHASSTLLEELDQLPGNAKGKSRDNAKESLSTLFKQAESLIKQVYVKHPSYDQIVPALLESGLDGLAERVPLTVGIPLHPMLGSPTRSLDEIYHRMGDLPFAAEFKYDGQRAQIHAFNGPDNKHKVKIFSRHLEDMTSKYPDVTQLVGLMLDESPGTTSFIMDAEIVAIDPTTGGLKSFQELSNRARKDVNIKDVQIAVCVFAFDLMYMNGKSLLADTFRERRSLLYQSFSPRKPKQTEGMVAHFDFVESLESEKGMSSIEEFMSKAVENRCEGLMIKLLDNAKVENPTAEKQSRLKSLPSTYEPDIRTSAWLKLKKDYMDSMGDSLDLIPIGAYHGSGRKAKWWSPVLLGLWNPDTGRPVAVCKCMSGFPDSFYKSMRERYELSDTENCSRQQLWDCDFGGFKPDVYFKPQEVWEIRGADITESPVSVAAMGMISTSRGLSLRFPRFIRIRDDKKVEQASDPAFLAGLWRSQQGKGKNNAGNDDGDLVDADAENSDLESFSDLEDEVESG
ncbi:DNA ligase [Crassisporium funariophilum]|nr:DNA ligase [Crassisporium funariophilum]